MPDLLSQIEPLIPAMRRYSRSFVRDAGMADDLVQDSLERVLAQWHTRRQAADTRSWVFAILHNVAVNHLRSQKRAIGLEDVDEQAVAVRPMQEDALRYRDLLTAIEHLPEDQRSVLLLVSVEDFSYAEAATALQVPLGTVMSRLSRARARLLQYMEHGIPVAPTTTKLKVVR